MNYREPNLMKLPFLANVECSLRIFWVVLAMGCVILLVAFGYLWIPEADLLDKQLMVLLNYDGNDFTDNFWYYYSKQGPWVPFLLAGVYCLMKRNKVAVKDRILMLLAIILLAAILDQVSSHVIKPWVCRLRPSHDPAINNLLFFVKDYRGGNFGFVSGHATNMVGVCTWLCMLYKDRFTRFTLITFTILMCYSRIYLGVHYPGDILAGSLLGFVISSLFFRLCKYYIPINMDGRRPHCFLAAFYATILALAILS